jgi:hypothetical protein
LLISNEAVLFGAVPAVSCTRFAVRGKRYEFVWIRCTSVFVDPFLDIVEIRLSHEQQTVSSEIVVKCLVPENSMFPLGSGGDQRTGEFTGVECFVFDATDTDFEVRCL